ncbi:MAG: PAS domain S-box protein, partial [Proteobacteria bacterium]|nr:PAS domain S-box protein [Pseudomonadota bacterium]
MSGRSRSDPNAAGSATSAQELRRLTRRIETLEALYEVSPSPMLLLDREGLVVAANRASLALLGDTEDEVVGKAVHEFFADEAQVELTRLLDMDWKGVCERVFVLADGRRVGLNVTSIPDSSEFCYRLGINDIT